MELQIPSYDVTSQRNQLMMTTVDKLRFKIKTLEKELATTKESLRVWQDIANNNRDVLQQRDNEIEGLQTDIKRLKDIRIKLKLIK